MSIRGARVLVADDQVDVAQTLCRILVSAGASVHIVPDGTEAFARLREGGFDLCIADMKMPPLPWGGLWLLGAMRAERLAVPLVVLSGEGRQRQTIEAMRLGAVDWIDKSAADAELLDRCEAATAQSRAAGLDCVTSSGPSPIAHAYERYRHSVGGQRQLTEGLRAMEETIRFIALLGLATSDEQACGPLRLPIERILRPSLGTWIEIVTEISRVPPVDPIARSLAAVFVDSRASLDRFVRLRNDLHHGGAEVNREQVAGLAEALETWAARVASASPCRPASPTSMQYDGDGYDVTLEEFTGVTTPRLGRARSTHPLQHGRPFLIRAEGDPIPLWPWFAVGPTQFRGASTRQLLVFDGLRQARRGIFADDDRLVYSDPTSRTRNIAPETGSVWSEAAAWFAPKKARVQR